MCVGFRSKITAFLPLKNGQPHSLLRTSRESYHLINDIRIWMNGRKLKLNDGKTEIIIVKGNLRSNVVEEFGDLELPCVLQFLLGIWASYLNPC